MARPGVRMNPDLPPILLLSLGVLAAAGLALLLLGVRGRLVNTHPVCRACRFDLVGLWSAERPGVCPECGGDLSPQRAVRFGQRRRRRLFIAAGLLLFLIGAVPLTAAGVAAARSYDWYRTTPQWWLEAQLAPGSPATRGQMRALGELARRARLGGLTQPRLDRLVAAGLALQARPAPTWYPAWGDLIDGARFSGRLDDTRWERYIRTGVPVALFTRTPDPTETNAPLGIRVGPARLGSRTPFGVRVGMFDAEMDGRLLEEPGAGHLAVASGGAMLTFILHNITPKPAPGKHGLRARCTFQILVEPGSTSPAFEWTEDLVGTLVIPDPASPAPTGVSPLPPLSPRSGESRPSLRGR